MSDVGNRLSELPAKKQARSTMIVPRDMFSSVSRINLILCLIAIFGFALGGCRTTTSPVPTQTDDGKRVIHFSGHNWWVKRSDTARGPGPNFYSDSEENVWLDKKGRLHMTIEKRDGKWWCAEVVTLASSGYGKYVFHLDSPVHGLDPNSVIGLFTWSDDTAQHNREIDIEITRWGEPTNHLGQFVVQPYDVENNIHRFPIPGDIPRVICSIDWGPDDIKFRATGGRFPRWFGRALSQWTYAGPDNPTPGDENMRINFWMNRGREPESDQMMELIIRRFEFTPRRD